MWLYFRFGLKHLKVERDPGRRDYTANAMTPVTDHEEQDFELFKSADALAYRRFRQDAGR